MALKIMTDRKSKGILQRLSGGVLSSSEKSGSIFKRGIAALAQNTEAESSFQSARFAYKAENFSEAALWCLNAADLGHVEAQSALGYCYEFGIGVTRDDAQAVHWYSKAAEQGDAEAQNALGDCYASGKGVTRDDAHIVNPEAKSCFQRALAAYKSENFSEVVLWCRKAADQGHALAQRNLGFCYELGMGVTQDDAQAVLWYRKSVEHGDSEGQNAVKGIRRDDAQSVLRYRVQADNSLSRARMRLYEARIRLGLPCDEYERRLRGLPTFDDDLFSTD